MACTSARRSVVLVVWAALVVLPTVPAQEKSATEIVHTFKGHTEPVYSVAFTPDGKFLATGSFDNTIKLWEVGSGKEFKTYGGPQGHQKMVMCVAVSPDGQFLASGSIDNTLKIWDVPMNTPVKSWPAPDPVQAVALSPDGTKVAFGDQKGQVKLVTAAEFKELAKLDGHSGPVTGVSFSPNGQVLASCGADKTVRFWNVANGQLLGVVGAHHGAVNAVAFSTNSAQAFSVGDDGQLRIWQVQPSLAKPITVAHQANVTAAFLSADGNMFYTASQDKTVRQTQVAAKEVRALTGATGVPTSVAVSANNALIAAGTSDHRVFLWNGPDGKPLGSFAAHGGPVQGAQFHPNQPQLLTAGADGLAKVWTLPANPTKAIAHPDGVTTSVVSADGKKLFTGSVDKMVRAWNLDNLAMERQLAGHAGPITALATSANGQALISGSADATIRFWNQQTGKESEIIAGHTAAVTALALNPPANQLLSSSEDGTLRLWQLPPVAPKAMVHPDQVTCLVVSPDGARAVTGGQDKIVRTWNLANGAKERDLGGPTLAVTTVALSPNGQQIAAGSADKTLHVWNLADNKVLQKLTFAAAVQATAFSTDGQNIVAGLADGTIKVHKIADGKEVPGVFPIAGIAHAGGVTGLAFSPKGDALFSCGADKAIKTWMPDGKLKNAVAHPAVVATVSLSKDGARLAAAGDKTIKVWNVADNKEVATITAPADIKSVGLTADGGRVVAAYTDNRTRVYEIDGKLVEIFPHEGPVHAAAFIDAKRVVSAGADKTARLWTSSLLWQNAHQGPVRRALFTPKGDIVSAGDDKAIRFWNAADGRETRALPAHDAAVLGIAVSGDGTRLASYGADKQVKVWNLAAAKPEDLAKPVAVLPQPAVPTAIAFTPNGQRLALAGEGNAIRILDIGLGKDVQVLSEHAAPITSLAFLADSRALVSGSLDKAVKVLDVNVLLALDAHPGGVVSAQYHNSGTQILTAGADKTVKLWDLAKSAVTKSFGPLAEPIKSAVFSRDFAWIGVAAGKSAKVFNLTDGKELASLAHPAEVLSLNFSQDKQRLLTGSTDKLTRVWDLTTAKELQFFAQEDAVAAVFYNPQNLVVSAAGKSARLDTPTAVRAIAVDAGPVQALAVVPNGAHVLTGGADKVVKMWNISNGQMERAFAGAADAVKAVAVSKNTQLVAVGGADQTVRLFHFNDAKEVGNVKVGAPIRSLAFAPNNLTLLASCGDKTLRSWSVPFQPGQEPTPEFLKSVQTFNAADVPPDLTVAADNATIWTAGLDKAVHTWKLAAENPAMNFPHPAIVDCVAFDPQSKRAATGCHDGKIRIWDLVKKAVQKEITAHIQTKPQMVAHPIYTVAFSADGKQLVSSSFDKTLKIWDVTSGNLVREFKAYHEKDFPKGHQEEVFAAAFSPDGKFLASGSGGLERVIKIWSVADGAVVRDLPNPALVKDPKQPAMSHPGWVYHIRFTKDGKLVSAGDAPKNHGYLAVWNPQDGKLLYADQRPIGAFFGLALAPDDKSLALAAGSRGRPAPELNNAYLIRIPVLGK